MMDTGPWTVRENVEEVYVESGDFKHDVALTVNGDFMNRAERLRYAKWLAGRLNRSNTELEVVPLTTPPPHVDR